MKEIEYSVVIRTTGKAGEKYRRLLESISRLEPKPKEIIVALPIGNAEPEDKLGWETFCYCKKGMVSQRMFGINACKTPYALVCDDDISFDSDFVRKLHDPIEKGVARLSAGPLISFLPTKGKQVLLSTLTGSAVPTVFHKEKYCHILSTTGYSYNRNVDTAAHKFMPSDSLAWTCFYAETSALREIGMEDEAWLDSHGYAAMDDQTMFYKAKLMGIKTVVVTDAIYEHLDAKTSTSSNEVKYNVIFAREYNRIIFWHRFLYSQHKGLRKVWDKICFCYSRLVGNSISRLRDINNPSKANIIAEKKKAKREAYKYILSEEYKSLPRIQRR